MKTKVDLVLKFLILPPEEKKFKKIEKVKTWGGHFT